MSSVLLYVFSLCSDLIKLVKVKWWWVSLEVVWNLNIMLSKIRQWFSYCYWTSENIAFINDNVLFTVKGYLLPMSRLGIRTSRKLDLVLHFAELTIKPCNYSRKCITSIECERIFTGKISISFSASIQVKLKYLTKIRAYIFALDYVNQRFWHYKWP